MVQRGSFIEELLQICWDRVVLHTGKDYIYVTQTRAFIAEMEALLAAKDLFKDDELLLLDSMARGKPHLTLHRKVVNSFLLKLVPFRSLEEFLESRTGNSKYDIMRLVRNLSISSRLPKREDTVYPRKTQRLYLSEREIKRERESERGSYIPESERGSYIPEREKASYFPERERGSFIPERERASYIPEREVSRPYDGAYDRNRRTMLHELVSRYGEGLDRTYLERDFKEDTTRPRDRENTRIERPYSADYSYNRPIKDPVDVSERPFSSGSYFSRLSANDNGGRLPLDDLKNAGYGDNDSTSLIRAQKRRIQDLEDKVQELTRETRLLQLQQKSPTQRSSAVFSELSAQVSEKEETIRNLERLCDRYQADVAKFAAVDKTNSSKTKKLAEALKTQDELIEKLKLKLQLDAEDAGTESSKLNWFLMNLPFIKQYFVYFKYQLDQRNVGSVFVNSVTLFLTCVLILNLLKMVLYGVVALGTAQPGRFSDYVYDAYDSSDEIGMVWWREILWLEYGVSSIGDWLKD